MFIDFGPNKPKTPLQRARILSEMYLHCSTSSSGDSSLSSCSWAIDYCGKEEGDDYLVILVSDANISSYFSPKVFFFFGFCFVYFYLIFIILIFFNLNFFLLLQKNKQELQAILTKSEKIRAVALFIASPKDSESIRREMDAGLAHVIMETARLPGVFQQVLASLIPSRL